MRRSLSILLRRKMAQAAIEGLTDEEFEEVHKWTAEFTTCESPEEYLEFALEEAFCS